MNLRDVDNLIAGLAVVRDDELSTALRADPASDLFARIVSTPTVDAPAPGVARLPRNRRRLLVAALAVTALVVTPAFALRGHVVHLFAAGADAPGPVERSFHVFDAGAPMDLKLGQARKVLQVSTPDGPVVIWAAPRQVGFCFGVGTVAREGDASTCTDRTFQLDPWPYSMGGVESQLVGAPYLIAGSTIERKATSIHVRLNDAETISAPLTWVSRPINAGFFVVWVPKRQWRADGMRFDAVAVDEHGAEIGPHEGMAIGRPTS